MLRNTLEAVGLRTKFDIPANEIFSAGFDFKKYGLTDSDKKRISVLKDFVTEYNREVPLDTAEPVDSSDKAAALMRPVLRELEQEELWAVTVTSRLIPKSRHKITVGSLDQTVIDKRTIVKLCLDHGAHGVVLYHNHPSGDPRPSFCDVKATEEIRNALQVFDMKLIDHLVISDNKYYSFAEEKTLKFKGE